MGNFFSLDGLIGVKREISDLESERADFQYDLDHKIRSWKIAEKEIARIDKKLAELRSKVK